MDLNLLEKTELRVQNVVMKDVNLTTIAEVVAEVLELPREKILVIDVRRDHFCLDLLEKTIPIENITGKRQELLSRLKNVEGLTLKENAYIDTRGIMGLINCEKIETRQVIQRTHDICTEVEKNVLGRALIYSTGFEVQEAIIEDTNAPYLIDILKKNGYKANFGGIVGDSKGEIKQKLMDAVDRGFGLVITTGGVGAEDKDFSVEALLDIAPDALTPYIVNYHKGTGRHVKSGVRIGVGTLGLTTIINLPGPHDEVMLAGNVLQHFCHCQRLDAVVLASELVRVLREKLQNKWGTHHG